MEQDLRRIVDTYDAVAEEWTKAFFGEHERKPKEKPSRYSIPKGKYSCPGI